MIRDPTKKERHVIVVRIHIHIDADTVRMILIMVVSIARIFCVVWERTNGINSFFLCLIVVVVVGFGQYGYFKEAKQ